jgi:hypothetical protein
MGKTNLSLGGAQFFKKTFSEKTEPNVNFGGISSTQTTTTFKPHIALTWERRVNTSLSIGIGFHYLTAQYTNINTNTFAGGASLISQQDVQAKIGGISFNSKLFFYTDSDFDLYFGGVLGLLVASENSVFSNGTGSSQINGTGSDGQINGLLDINIGGRCLLTENLGLYAEVGYVSVYSRKAMAGQAGVIFWF